MAWMVAPTEILFRQGEISVQDEEPAISRRRSELVADGGESEDVAKAALAFSGDEASIDDIEANDAVVVHRDEHLVAEKRWLIEGQFRFDPVEDLGPRRVSHVDQSDGRDWLDVVQRGNRDDVVALLRGSRPGEVGAALIRREAGHGDGRYLAHVGRIADVVHA